MQKQTLLCQKMLTRADAHAWNCCHLHKNPSRRAKKYDLLANLASLTYQPYMHIDYIYASIAGLFIVQLCFSNSMVDLINRYHHKTAPCWNRGLCLHFFRGKNCKCRESDVSCATSKEEETIRSSLRIRRLQLFHNEALTCRWLLMSIKGRTLCFGRGRYAMKCQYLLSLRYAK